MMQRRANSTENIKSPDEIEKMRVAGKHASEILRHAKGLVRPGVNILEIEEAIRVRFQALREQGITSGAHLYDLNGSMQDSPFPAYSSICPGEVVANAIPVDRVLKEGEIVSIDCMTIYEGYYADTAITIPVGEVDNTIGSLIEASWQATNAAIRNVRPGATIEETVQAIERVLSFTSHHAIPGLSGHGIGRTMHDELISMSHSRECPTFERMQHLVFVPGMAFTIEPHITNGPLGWEGSSDRWTLVKKDKDHPGLTSYFEAVVVVTDDGCEVLTPLPINI